MQRVRRPAVAGMFYEGGREELKRQVASLLPKGRGKEKSSIVISPHAGYVYSGRTAASAISTLRKSGTYVVLGPNHTGLGVPFSVMPAGTWQTPLGDCEIDTETARKLEKCAFVEEDEYAHIREHSIEVQLPLLQHMFGSFRFVPLCIMNTDYSQGFLERCKALGKAISGIMRNGDVSLVASTDFSHYVPRKESESMDGAAVKRIMELDSKGFFRSIESTGASVCGFGPIAVAIEAARELELGPKLIERSDSGDATGDYDSVVAYYAIGFF